ncbi:hypothetical protein [Deinococcus radiotolerans]|uniref:hypothetical protein n=1 Tax=Deinococcus radiotolerans TaxID=1309407 RepID=UPI001662AD59|nr:hypothetical protein [Deinococcus radiotolerans]
MDDFDLQVKARMDARQAEQEAEERAAVRVARDKQVRRDHSMRIVRDSAGVVFDRMAERLRLHGLEAQALETWSTADGHTVTHLDIATKTGPRKSALISASKAPLRDTIVLTAQPPFEGHGSLEFDHADQVGMERVIQGWVLRWLDS